MNYINIMNMKRLIFYTACILSMPFFISCGANCINGEGENISDKRPVDGAVGICLDIEADVSVVKGPFEVINIVAQQNILEKIKTQVDDGVLKITSNSCFTDHEPIRIVVTLPEIESLELNGSGRIWLPDTFAVNDVKLELNGSGSIDAKFIAAKIETEIRGSGKILLAGSANIQEVSVVGSGDFLAEKLPCNETTVKDTGSGNANVYVIKEMDVKITGSGMVKYRGKPELTSKVTGSGKVVDDNK